jgi:hypothetical protein
VVLDVAVRKSAWEKLAVPWKLVQFSAVVGDGALTSAIAAAVMARSVVREIFSINFFELTFSHAASIMGG